MQRPIIFGVLQRIEYFYRNKDQIIAPKLDGEIKFGSYGMIEVTVIFYYPTIPGKLYHPVYNADETEWWLEFYRSQTEIVRAVFVPAPQSKETMLPFVIPDLGSVEIIDEADNWYKKEIDEYTV